MKLSAKSSETIQLRQTKAEWYHEDLSYGGIIIIDLESRAVVDYDGVFDLPEHIKNQLHQAGIKTIF